MLLGNVGCKCLSTTKILEILGNKSPVWQQGDGRKLSVQEERKQDQSDLQSCYYVVSSALSLWAQHQLYCFSVCKGLYANRWPLCLAKGLTLLLVINTL